MRCILIFTNGDLPNPDEARRLLQEDGFIIAADGGTHHVLALGRLPDLVIGDFDSITPEDKQRMEQENVELIKFPSDKNETDLELAIDHALKLAPLQIIVIGALGRQIDHTLGNISLLSDPRFAGLDVRFDDGVEELMLCRDQVQIHGSSGDIVSLLPWGGEVTGIVTRNLKWPLENESLYPHKTRGISNEILGEEASIRIKTGLLLIVHRRVNK